MVTVGVELADRPFSESSYTQRRIENGRFERFLRDFQAKFRLFPSILVG